MHRMFNWSLIRCHAPQLHKFGAVLCGMLACVTASAQEATQGTAQNATQEAVAEKKPSKVQLHGSVQTEFLVPQADEAIGTEKTDNKVQNNTYADLGLTSKYVDAGLRVEFLQFPMPGYDPEFKGWGVPNLYVKGKLKGVEITAGSVYEQFGSGLILRAYEDRPLGIDNSIFGGRVKVNALKGLRFTALAGVQRTYWKWNWKSQVYGADAEFDLDQYIKPLDENGIAWSVGASWVLKHESNDLADNNVTVADVTDTHVNTYAVNYPSCVNAVDARTQFSVGGFSLLAEYAYKSQDPSAVNNYTFHKGQAALLSASYSQKGFSALLQAKRSENMSFRSQRGITGEKKMGMINHMPAFTFQHTYALPSLYPYGTQYGKVNDESCLPGEWAFQGEVSYNFKRKTPMGGKYGTKLKLNASHVRALDSKPADKVYSSLKGTDGYSASFFGMGEELYTDVNLTFEKKFSKVFKLNAMYMFQDYNKTLIEGHGGMIRSHIFVLDGRFQFNPSTILRAEFQYLTTRHDSGDWVQGLLELSAFKHWMFTVSDMYGRPETAAGYTKKTHYYMASVTFSHGAHRAMVGYGLTRRGFDCSGGVCREVPATKGPRLTYNFTF